MVLLRKVIGDALRARRLGQHRTLREVSTAANVSLGYLSEIERGHKEASSELLAAICEALGAPLSSMLNEVSTTLALAEQMEDAFSGAPALQPAATGARNALRAAPAKAPLNRGSLRTDPRPELDEVDLEAASLEDAEPAAVTEGDVTVSVHSDGPLRTRLTTKRIPPGQRYSDPQQRDRRTPSLFVG